MNYYNLKYREEIIDFKTATIKGQGKEKGLFFPEFIPQFDPEFIKNLNHYSDEEIAFRTIKDFVGDEIPSNVLKEIVSETINFEIPLKKINEQIYSLELFHGPTFAFKDVGARFMSRCLSYFLKDENKKITVLVATSGDTGGAVANGFYRSEIVNVVILYPKNKVSEVQEKQLTALGENIFAMEVNGSFDDCQNLVKQAFLDEEINSKLFLTSANSINVARWLPQQIYYLLALKQWQKLETENPIICVPSGNFGNICAGLLTHFRGLYVEHFIAACNENDIIPNYLKTEKLEVKETIATVSNAMDVGNPSNFIRILELFENHFANLKSKVSGYSIDDENTLQTIKEVFEKYNYILDPHTAVAYTALEIYLKENPGKKGFILATAHPVKFPDIVKKAINTRVKLPDMLKDLVNKRKKSIEIRVDFEEFKEYLLNNF